MRLPRSFTAPYMEAYSLLAVFTSGAGWLTGSAATGSGVAAAGCGMVTAMGRSADAVVHAAATNGKQATSAIRTRDARAPRFSSDTVNFKAPRPVSIQ